MYTGKYFLSSLGQVFISCRLHRKDMVAGLGRSRPTQAERVLALLVESGVVFCIPQVLYYLQRKACPWLPSHSRLLALYWGSVLNHTFQAQQGYMPRMCSQWRISDFLYEPSFPSTKLCLLNLLLSQAMYPTIVIALVNTQRTFDHVYSANTSLRTNHGGEADHITTIRFGQPDPVNSVETPPQQVEKNRDTQAV